MNSSLKIIFFGTAEFAVASLQALVENNFNVMAVVTAPDRPAGRGLMPRMSAVKQFALQKNLTLRQPEKLKEEKFLEEIRQLQPDLMIVVAFRMMPRELWQLPASGTFNLHASLLPQYRGAAPVHWAIINGETETGVTTFFLRHEIDQGDIIFNEKVAIRESETAGALHDKLMRVGADLVIKTVKAIESGNVKTLQQESVLRPCTLLKPAPKIFKKDCLINWNTPAESVYNHIRGLSPYPAAYTEFLSPDGGKYIL